jgi:hypothetical protein
MNSNSRTGGKIYPNQNWASEMGVSADTGVAGIRYVVTNCTAIIAPTVAHAQTHSRLPGIFLMGTMSKGNSM